MAIAPEGIGVHQFDELTHRVDPVANDVWRVATGGCDQSVADDEHAEVVAGNVALDDHVPTDIRRHCVGGVQLSPRFDVDGDALALIAVARLDHDRKADQFGDLPGLLFA